jgi:hypothetical protein
MTGDEKKAILQNLKRIPGVGDSIAQDLFDLGYRSIEELKDQDPQAMYRSLCRHRQSRIDRCMLYVMRCAVYFASHDHHDPELLKWWNWRY